MGIELAYINTKHPDFTEAGLVHKTISDNLDSDIRKMNIRETTPGVSTIKQVVNQTEGDRVSYGWATQLSAAHCSH